jgi:hypothetical protein
VHTREPLGRGTDRLGHAGRVRARRPTGPSQGFGPKAEFKYENFLTFSKLFYKLQINLNSNQI